MDDNHNAVTTCTNVECEVGGEHLAGFVVDDGARHWVWARNSRDAMVVVATTMIVAGDPDDVESAYEAATGQRFTDAWVCPPTEETMGTATFREEDGSERPMLDEFYRNKRRGLVASSEF